MQRPSKVLILLSFLWAVTGIAANPYFKQGMVVSEHRLASQVGIDILQAGGNAIDAAVAVGYALAVVNPCCGNIGGGGFMTIHTANNKNIVLNFREKSPLNATKNMYLDRHRDVIANESTKGYLAVAVPGTVLGLDTALKQYGTMTRQQVMTPAIRLAQQGYIVTEYEANLFNTYATAFREQNNIGAIFLKQGHTYKAGDRLIQTDLANTLKLLAVRGADAFYKGPIANAIVAASQAHGGILTLADFSHYNIEQQSPISCHYHGFTVLSTPLPGGGNTLCDILSQLQTVPLKQFGFLSAKSIRAIVAAMGDGFAKRNNSNTTSHTTQHRHELTDTTHYSIVDNKGNAVAVTYTLNGFFGAQVIADHTGFFLNNEMDDFSIKAGFANKFDLVQSKENAIQPGKRPLSSMSPTIVIKNGQVCMVIGSPGGPRIITAILLTLLNVIDYDMSLQDATNAPRFHYQGIPDSIDIEPSALSPDVMTALLQQGYHISPQHTWAAIEAIQIDPTTGKLKGANDYRRPDGAALGY